jgi:tetratricopeptide (TPR) repeat protein
MIRIVWAAVTALVLAATSVSAQDPAAQARRAKQAMANGNLNEAISIYAHLSVAFPQNLDIKRNLGLALHSARRYSDALHCFGEILERAPGDPASLLFSGIDLTLVHRPADAIHVLTTFLSHDSQNPTALVTRGGAYLALDHLSSAVDDFSKAAELDPQSVQAWEGLARRI